MHNGFLNVLKPPGMTSHDVVSALRKIYGQKRIGHAGTLDPGAAGVLPVALGQATRLLEYLPDGKSYRAELTFGYCTDSGDDLGKVLRKEAVQLPAVETIAAALAEFTGKIQQIPPMHSAIKINGMKLYQLARQGISIDVPARTICIDHIHLLAVKKNQLLFDVDCSKGTYIRTLCLDIGRKLNIPAVMSFLVRTRVGIFQLQDAWTIEEVKEQPAASLLSMDTALTHLPQLVLNEAQSKAFQQGQKIRLPNQDFMPSTLRIYDEKENFIGIGNYVKTLFHVTPTKVIAH